MTVMGGQTGWLPYDGLFGPQATKKVHSRHLYRIRDTQIRVLHMRHELGGAAQRYSCHFRTLAHFRR